MQNNSNDSSEGLFLLALIGLGYFWWQSSNLQKQIKELQAQNTVYESCVSDYQTNESKLTEVIQNANNGVYKVKQDVDDIPIYSYNPYLDTYSLSNDVSRVQSDLNVDTNLTNCNIPDAPDVPTPTP